MISTVYKEILGGLITIHEKKRGSIKGEEIAALLDKTAGTIRNQMQTLRALGYVDGIPGPKGGYLPTLKAYEVLRFEHSEYFIEVPVYQNNERVEGLIVQQIIFSNVSDPKACRCTIKILGDTFKIHDGNMLKVGPTPINKIMVVGKVIGRNDADKEILLATKSITSVPRYKVCDMIVNQRLVSFNPDTALSECEETLIRNKIDAAPVVENGKIIGIVSLRDIVCATVEKKAVNTASGIMETYPVTISANAQLADAVTIMKKNKVKRVVIVDSNTYEPKGIVSMTDIINLMLE
ncbi:MAG: CBS domain-containing protein [Candidatus Altiarchaeum hamiconexum]|uniref:CBS domain-containing protein n=1 Tax=Candidatus Altarchaeum hamiconexum TaxID=1803513 RepID=A0A8J8CKR0_9ARCH|nr:CBS domain-containing protein [Candidatus Altarchaeum hamiconexum]OIQ06180.1 MAG: hypothetical protein AUK59_00820 [Candidatus Altarchaeum sp. CG2_30_32_3053]